MANSNEIAKWARAALDILGDLRRPLAGRVEAAHEILREALADHDAAVGTTSDPKKDEIAKAAAQRWWLAQDSSPDLEAPESLIEAIREALSSQEEELRKVRESDRLFPILDGPAIPWSVIQPWEKFARLNHGQTLERLAERGGLACAEAIAVLRGERHRAVAALTTSEARDGLMRLVEQRSEMVPRLVHRMVQAERDEAVKRAESAEAELLKANERGDRWSLLAQEQDAELLRLREKVT